MRNVERVRGIYEERKVWPSNKKRSRKQAVGI